MAQLVGLAVAVAADCSTKAETVYRCIPWSSG